MCKKRTNQTRQSQLCESCSLQKKAFAWFVLFASASADIKPCRYAPDDRVDPFGSRIEIGLRQAFDDQSIVNPFVMWLPYAHSPVKNNPTGMIIIGGKEKRAKNRQKYESAIVTRNSPLSVKRQALYQSRSCN